MLILHLFFILCGYCYYTYKLQVDSSRRAKGFEGQGEGIIQFLYLFHNTNFHLP
jgi:hypothetical protein